jgi:hypothetical protein
MSEIIFLPAIYEGGRDLKDKTKKLVFQSNEISPAQAANLQMCVQQFVYLAIKREDFTKEQVDLINNLRSDYVDTAKSQAQRMRNVLFVLWQQNSEGYLDFNLFYEFKMEGFIKYLKSKLP